MNINIYPGFSTDIHLFRSGEPVANVADPVGTTAYVLFGLYDNGVQELNPIAKKAIILASLTYDTDTDEMATSQPYVQVDVQPDSVAQAQWIRLVFKVAPNAPLGQTYCRLAYNDGSTPDYYNIMFRVTVHESLSRFWLGNKRLTVFDRATITPEESQACARELVVYGECLEAPGVVTYADLTASSYISYTNPASVIIYPSGLVQAELPQPAPPLPLLVRVRIGTKKPEPHPGTTAVPDVPVYVRSGAKGSRKLLRRLHTGAEPDINRKLKILLLTQGFTVPTDVKSWLALMQTRLFEATSTPFDRLKENIDIWTADLPADDPDAGITLRSPLNAQGYLVPAYPIVALQLNGRTVPVDRAPGQYKMVDLLARLGLPAPLSPAPAAGSAYAAAVANAYSAAQANWVQKFGGKTTRLPFDPTKVPQDLFEAWLQQVPAQFVYVKDTGLDFAKGTRQIRYAVQSRTTRGTWGLGRPDVNIYFPAFSDIFIKDSVFRTTLASLKSQDAKAPNVEGARWLAESKDELAAGFVCVLVNDAHEGAATRSAKVQGKGDVRIGRAAVFSAGTDDTTYVPTSAAPITNVQVAPSLTTAPTALALQRAQVVAAQALNGFVHEFGHAFGLGDEYGDGYSRLAGHHAALTKADDAVDTRPNLTTGHQLNAEQVTALTSQQPKDPATNLPLVDSGGNAIFLVSGKLLDASKLKWNWDRTELAATLLAAPQAGSTATRFTLKVAPDQKWESRQNTTLIVRARALSTTTLDPSKLFEVKLTLATRKTPQAPAKPYYELQVEGALPGIVAGDVVYAPRYYPAAPTAKPTDPRIKMRLMAQQVADLLQTTRFPMTDEVKDYRVAAAHALDKQDPLPMFQAAMVTDLQNQLNATGVTYAYRIVGPYEGGGEYDSGTYRSSGQSKMRDNYFVDSLTSRVVPFNYVSQYYIINRVNPDKLAELDKDYDTYAH